MGYIIEIEKSAIKDVSKSIGEALSCMMDAMYMVDDLCKDGNYGERNYRNMGYRSYGGYRGGMGYRDDEDMPMYDDMGNPVMGMRRMRDSRGRYM